MTIDHDIEAKDIACPFCDTLELMLFTEDELNWIGCLNCRACGPTADSPENATAFWLDRPLHTAEPPELTKLYYEN
jgi:transcription elongation factor Elf1